MAEDEKATKPIIVGDHIAIKIGEALVIHAMVTEVTNAEELFGEDAETVRVLLTVKE